MKWQECARPPITVPVAMQQHAHYGRTCDTLGSPMMCFAYGPAHAPRAVAQILIRKWPLFGHFALLARGPVWLDDVTETEASRATSDLVASLRKACRGVIVTAECVGRHDPMASAGLLPLFTGGHQARLSLSGDSAARMARQHGKWRNRLRRALEDPLTIRHAPLPADPDHWLLQYETRQSRKRGYRRLPSRFTTAWVKANGPKSARLFIAEINAKPVAAMLFLLHGVSASYHIGWSGDDGRAAGAHTRLLWEASEWLARKGYAWVDLGTLDTETTPGLARFKLGAGAVAVPLGQTWMDAPGAKTVASVFGSAPAAPSQPGQCPTRLPSRS